MSTQPPATRTAARAAGRPMGFDRDDVLARAMDMLWRGGFEATPIGDLIDRMGLSRSSFYAAFGSKRGVMLAALRMYSDRCVALLTRIAEAPGPARARLARLMRCVAQVDDDRGCFMVNVVTERGRHDDEVRRLAAAHHAALDRIFAATLDGADEADEADGARRLPQASAMISAAYGASMLGAAGLSRDEVGRMLDALAGAD